MPTIEALTLQMIEFDRGDPRRIQHFLKVHTLARTIALAEGLGERERLITEAAALVHDIGIHKCEEKYGECGGKLQEKEGPPLAEQLLGQLGFDPALIRRVSFLVGHHHTYTGIDGPDYQILVEADFLVNFFEDSLPRDNIRTAFLKVFKTATGRQICTQMFGL